MFKKTCLYIKTHNITGLKYFGKTTASDPHSYKGSGKYWKRHIDVHGYDVKTDILGWYDTEESCRIAAIEFSNKNNIVESKEWANLKKENGKDGGFDHLNSDKELHSERSRKAGKRSQELYPDQYKNMAKGLTAESAKKTKSTILDRYGNEFYSNIAKYERTEEHKQLISDSLKGVKQEIAECPWCGSSGGIRAMKRWHFDNCKNRGVSQLEE